MKKSSQSESATLRQQAEKLLSTQVAKSIGQLSEAETYKLLHEIQVHQIELELQNDELIRTREQATIASDKYIELYDFAPSGYFTLSCKGEIIQLNLLGAKMLDKDRSQLKNRLFHLFVSDNTKSLFLHFLERVFNSGTTESCEIILSIKGHPQYIYLTGIIAKDEDQCHVTATNTTERRQAEDELRQSEKRFHSIYDNMREGVALHDLVFEGGKPVNYRIIDVNNRFLEKIGVSREQVVGKLSTEVYGTATPSYLEIYTEVAINKKSIGFESYFASLDKHFIISVAPWNENGFATILSDITDRKRSEEELNLKNIELQRLDMEKDKFFSIIAHDLRSPFNTFLGFTQLMVEDLSIWEPDELQKVAETMRQAALNLYGLLNNLLEWSQIQKGSIYFDPISIRLRSTVDENLTMALETAKSKGIELVCDIPENIKVFADIHFLQTILRNLLSNAMKFTPPGGEISLSAKSGDNNNIVISIHDTGIGMNQKMLDNLFRIDVKTTRMGINGEASSGLGLLLCKEFVVKQGGKIWVESEVGQGSTFYFTLPVC
ncbi:PAS domain S-box protein [bacterium]|nr:PAS domain S-box protein [bacterium]